MSCLPAEVISAFVAGTLDPDAMLAANTHARACRGCHGALVRALQLSVNLSTVEHALSPPTPDVKRALADALTAGTPLGRYTVLALVGRGGMGQVYSAYDPQLDRRVALKVMHADAHDARAQDRLLREAQSIARLSHPNVVVVHDVGTVGDRVFVAMEFVDGVTLATWTKTGAKGWREILRAYVQAARGLAAAHRAGLVHRDFKPQNAMVNRQGVVRVMDFGLARRIEGMPALDDDASPPTVGAEVRDLALTRPGERLGTPRYMAPEQFRGEPIDERTDQFAFCVALFEALYGAHPFEDDTYLALSLSVSAGELRPVPKDRDVPAWLRRAVVRGLSRRPEARHASMAALATALEADPAAARRRRLVAAGVVGLAAASLLGAREIVVRRRAELDRRVAAALAEADDGATAAGAAAARARALRASAFESFDGLARDGGEALWREAVPLGASADGLFENAERGYETALLLDGGRADARSRLAGVQLEHLRLADELGLAERARALEVSLGAGDPRDEHLAAARAPGTVTLDVRPAAATIVLERYELDPATQRRASKAPRPLARGAAPLPAGSYRLTLRGPGLAEIFFPFVVGRGERVAVDVEVPPAAAVPAGFVYVPAGAFSFGDRDERARHEFLDTVPLHRRTTDAYLIARTETTYRAWIAFLEALPPAERQRRAPHLSSVTRGSLWLREASGGWHLAFQPGGKRYEARAGEPIEYVGRETHVRQDWLDFPVAGVSMDDIERYATWLSETGRVPGARPCTELEWERAARGADDRPYPHGDDLAPADANFDATYGRVDAAYGPDAVGAHPAGRSPFGVDDLAGNVGELVTSALRNGEILIRGGGYFFNAATARSTNRSVVPRTFQDVTIGFRVCAPAPR